MITTKKSDIFSISNLHVSGIFEDFETILFCDICWTFHSLCSSCLNNGTCVDGINSFSCRCRPGFTGPFCQYEINECESQPCKNGGTCTDGLGTYHCTCPMEYNGRNCQVHTHIVPSTQLLFCCLYHMYPYMCTNTSVHDTLWHMVHCFLWLYAHTDTVVLFMPHTNSCFLFSYWSIYVHTMYTFCGPQATRLIFTWFSFVLPWSWNQ